MSMAVYTLTERGRNRNRFRLTEVPSTESILTAFVFKHISHTNKQTHKTFKLQLYIYNECNEL